MQFFPSREVFVTIGSVEIRWYAVLITVGALLAYLLSAREGKKKGYDSEVFDDLLIGILAFGILGARLWYCIFYDFSGYFSNPISLIEIWDGGLAIQGGLIAGVLFVYIYCKVEKYSFFHIADIVFPYVLIAQAMGRWGNYANQECYGAIVEESYYDGILSFLKDGMYILGHYREPMFFYESVLCVLGFVLIKLYMRTSKPLRGKGMYCYFAWYGAIRFWIESKRTDSLMIGNFRVAQIISVVFVVIGVIGLAGLINKLFKPKKPVIIFDLDGTLLDTRKAIGDSFEYVLSQYRPDYVVTEEDRAAFMGPTLEETFRKYVPERSNEVEGMVAMYRKYNVKAQKESVTAFPHVKELLDYLKENGYQFGIASSKKTDMVEYGLKIAGLDGYFDVIIGCEKCNSTKPDKEPIVKAYKALGGTMSNAIYIGDCAVDVEASKNAGTYAIAYCSNPLKEEELKEAKPNKLIYDMADVEEILQENHPFSYDLS